MQIRCAKCKTILDELADGHPRKPCPACGATSREIDVLISQTVQIHDSLRAKGKRPGFGMLFDTFVGHDFSVRLKRWVKKRRLVDRENRWYSEEVVDPETGEIIHSCSEPLADHQGHGSAKFVRRNTKPPS